MIVPNLAHKLSLSVLVIAIRHGEVGTLKNLIFGNLDH